MEKIWNFNGIDYTVSSDGKIYGKSGKELSLRLNSDGYVEVTVGSNKLGRKRLKLHRIIGLLFVDGYKDGYEINHKDFNRANNNSSNLEWVSHKENISYSYTNGRHIGSRAGEKNGRSILNIEQVKSIRKEYENGKSIYKISKDYGVGWSTVKHIVDMDTWK